MSTISASTTTTTAYKVTADTTGTLVLQTGASPTTAVTIDGSQNVGIGTSSPTAKLHVAGSAATGLTSFNSTGTTTAYNITSITNTSGSAYYGVEGSSGGTVFTGSTAYAALLGTGGATSLQFATNNNVRATIDSSGNLLVGTTTAGAGAGFATKLAVDAGAADTSLFKTSGGSSSAPIRSWNASTTTDGQFVAFATEATYTTRGTISYNRGAGLTAYNTTSDYRAKTVNGLVQNALTKVAALKPSTGRMNGAEYDIDFFVAHELQEVVPSAVTGEKDAVDEDGAPKYQMVDKSALIPLLTAAIQELKAELDAAKADIATLKGQA